MNIRTGDIGMYKGDSWLARHIQIFMDISRKKKGLPERELYNHTFVFVRIFNRLYVCEALENGVTFDTYNNAYRDKKDRVTIKKPVIPFTDEEKSTIVKECIWFVNKRTKYQFFNFISQAIWITTDKWIGNNKHNAKRRVYCTELIALILNKARKMFNHPERQNPLTIDLNKNYE